MHNFYGHIETSKNKNYVMANSDQNISYDSQKSSNMLTQMLKESATQKLT